MSTCSASRVLIYVQHLLGVGHLQRALQLSDALLQHGFQVDLVSGGLPTRLQLPANLRIHQLPPVYSADGSFSRLLDTNGDAIDDDWRERRKRQLLDIFNSSKARVLITETFPFGRRMLRFELLPLLEASRKSVECRQVIASIRDILQPRSKPGRDRETCELIDAYYDHVLVHGDANIARLEDSFASADCIADKLYYSGYICAQTPSAAPSDAGTDEVLVSAGGSDTGLQILRAALAAKPLSACKDLHWRLLVSPAISSADFNQLQELADDGVSVERNRTDFSALIKRARLSISQAGYNTMTDLLSSDTPAVVIPYAEGDEIEQTLRAQVLQARGRLIALNQTELGALSLARSIAAALATNTKLAVNLNGADNSAVMITRWLNEAEEAR
ncbi:MAG TPA: glycosyltransferase [Gammaproteobacteria bacterium]|nr:glycosyltransferase [Gammaproteobacteria bacterium]